MLEYNNLRGYDLAATVAYNAGFRGNSLILAIAIAKAESDCMADMLGDINLENEKWGPSVGLWQIRSLNNPYQYNGIDQLRIKNKLFEPQYNASTAFLISKKGADFNPWSAYTNGSYKKFINDALGVIDRLSLDS